MDIEERAEFQHLDSPESHRPSNLPVRRKITAFESLTPITQHKTLKPLDLSYLNNNGGPAMGRPVDKDSVKGWAL